MTTETVTVRLDELPSPTKESLSNSVQEKNSRIPIWIKQLTEPMLSTPRIKRAQRQPFFTHVTYTCIFVHIFFLTDKNNTKYQTAEESKHKGRYASRVCIIFCISSVCERRLERKTTLRKREPQTQSRNWRKSQNLGNIQEAKFFPSDQERKI